MDEQFDIRVSGVTKREFSQAGAELVRGTAVPLLVAVAVVTLVIMMFMGDYSLKALLPPFAVVLILLAVARLMVGRGYKDFPKDTEYSFLIDVEGWQLTVADTSANVDWQDTAKLVVRRHAVLLYNEDNRSNLLPRRCVTDHQLAMMRTWFQASRPAYRARQRVKSQAWREDSRQRRENSKSKNGRRRFF